MLIRFAVKNLFSFKEETEFNLLPSKAKRLGHHKYPCGNIEVLKLSALYGANGSGKSNFIRAVSLLKTTLLSGKLPAEFHSGKFKLSENALTEPVEFGIEFFAGNTVYYYTITVNNGMVLDEYFGTTDEKMDDVPIFHRIYENQKTNIQFFDEFEVLGENLLLKKIIETDLLKPNQPLFSLLNTISNSAFAAIKTAYLWFEKSLVIIYPQTKPAGLALQIESEPGFKEFADELMVALNTGINKLKVEEKGIEDFFGKENQTQIDKIKTELINNPDLKMALLTHANTQEEVAVVNRNGTLVAKRILFEHLSENNESIDFNLNEESDGTKRLLEYLPMLYSLLNHSITFIIDEIERSIHPLLVKELIGKFSTDEKSAGQLVFSTHESNLLDQEIFRTDEIWFAEKSILGYSKLYSLSDFKEHNTIDIRKGYLTGRYGAIPFLGNLHDLNWNTCNE